MTKDIYVFSVVGLTVLAIFISLSILFWFVSNIQTTALTNRPKACLLRFFMFMFFILVSVVGVTFVEHPALLEGFWVLMVGSSIFALAYLMLYISYRYFESKERIYE